MNGPMPIMLDMFSAVACSRPKRRGRETLIDCQQRARRLDAGRFGIVAVEPSLNVGNARSAPQQVYGLFMPASMMSPVPSSRAVSSSPE